MTLVVLRVKTKGRNVGDEIDVDPEIAHQLVSMRQARYAPGVELGLEVDLGTVAGVLSVVGDDKEQAQAALDAEREKGDGARVTLISALEAIVSA